MPSLVGKDGSAAGRRFDIDSEATIGRENADILLEEDDEVSRLHATLRPLGGMLEIEDAGSTNGTFVNGIRVLLPTRLSPGDSIRVGQTHFEVEGAGAPTAPAEDDDDETGWTSISTVVISSTPGKETSSGSRVLPREARQEREARAPTQPLPVGARTKTPSSTEGPGWRSRTTLLIVGGVIAVLLLGYVAANALLDGGVSKEDYIASADRICARTNRELRRIDLFDDRAARAVRRDVARVRRIWGAAIADIADLERPDEGVAQLRRFLAASEGVDRSLARFESVVGARDQGRVRRGIRAVDRAASGYERAARDYGFTTCAQSPI